MVRTLTGIYTVKIYQWPVYIVEDMLHLEIVMSSVYTIFLERGWVEERKKLTGYLKKYSFIDILLKILQVNLQSYDS